MIEKIESQLRKGQYWIEDDGDGIFICLCYVPSETEQEEIWTTACYFFDDVQWCPEPEGHTSAGGVDAEAVLNCFYRVERGEQEDFLASEILSIVQNLDDSEDAVDYARMYLQALKAAGGEFDTKEVYRIVAEIDKRFRKENEK